MEGCIRSDKSEMLSRRNVLDASTLSTFCRLECDQTFYFADYGEKPVPNSLHSGDYHQP